MTASPHFSLTGLRALAALALASALALSGVPHPAAAAGAESKPKTTVSVGLPSAPLLVQINQVALERQGPKRAIVEYAGDAEHGRYTVLRDGKPIKRGELQPLPAFTAWAPGKRYFSVDFSDAQQAGRYHVEVSIDQRQARSAVVPVRDDAIFATAGAQLLGYFKRSRHTDPADRDLPIFQTTRRVNAWGGWQDAGGDKGKYLSHLGYANHFNPQQASMAAWVLAYGAHARKSLFAAHGLQTQVEDEAFWGADYLHRILDADGYFYTTVFDQWGTPGAVRMVTGYEGAAGTYTALYRSAFRAGGGMAIAALARASMLAKQSGRRGEFDGAQYLADAERAYAHLRRFNPQYGADGKENIIDDYTALMALVELHNATGQSRYLDDARARAASLIARQQADGGFVSDGGRRPYYHAAEAGLPVISLSAYAGIEPEQARRQRALDAIGAALKHELAITDAVANPYGYARQRFQLAQDGQAAGEVLEGFFIPHRNETGYWWQGESARLASLSAAMAVGGRALAEHGAAGYGLSADRAGYAQSQLDWTLGRNPYGICMLYGFGRSNPPTVLESAGEMFVGGISNGITGAVGSDTGAGIAFAPGPDSEQWRWVEQWIPHTTWMLYAVMAMSGEEAR
ncbi:glycosyl hydrolase, family 9 [Lysobacter enzymogenes]|uniref:Glycosyl hydrolase, family 9 n=1 Tax=Lysobacter enzymogenes TaxID=69 RepID=A0A0S2DHP6_LYSEN|nr:glycoside hydrolase family 9 protein [Lysobacter enzymogenes]ALN57885.1 glycosyl hydrolase, family 9 [Lysobacter enzymogenes]QCW26402.1 glycosyl hydrolase [Lysobacter enzymogenes]